MGKKMRCPNPFCRSHNVEVMGGGNKHLSAGKGIVGGALLGVPGILLGGMMGKKDKYEMFCKDCGKRWKTK